MSVIKINNEELVYDNVVYADAIEGDDNNGDGTKENPYFSLEKAMNVTNEGDAIFLKQGVFEHIGSTADLKCDLIGDPREMVTLRLGSSGSWSRSLPVFGERKIIGLIIEHVLGGENVYVIGAKTSKHSSPTIDFYNCVFKEKVQSYNDTMFYKAKVSLYNCFDNVGVKQYGGTLSVLQNSVKISDTSQFNTENTNILKSDIDVDETTWNITSGEWRHKGTGQNPDGSKAHIGVYGGLYSWKFNNKILLLSEKEKVKSIFDSKYLENAIPEMISNLEPYGRVRASSNENIAYCAFNNTTDHWVGDTDNEWIEYEFNKPIIIKELSLIAQSSGHGSYWMRGIKNFSLCVSNNGKNYFTVFEGEHPNTNSEVSYEIENDKAWKYIRIYITSVYHNTAATKQVRVRKIGISGKTPMSTLETDDLSKRSFISYGMSLKEISNIKFSQKFTEKHYIQSKSTPLGSGKVFEQPLDVDKIIESVKIE